jgi:hypothetical protein
MIARIHLVVDSDELAVFVDQKTHTTRVTRLTVSAGAVRHPDAAVGIAKQRKGKVVLLSKAGILFDIVEADAEDLNIVLLEVGNLIAEPATLDRSARCIGLWIKPEYNLAPTQFRECDLLALVTAESEIRRWFANLEHYSASSLGHRREQIIHCERRPETV